MKFLIAFLFLTVPTFSQIETQTSLSVSAQEQDVLDANYNGGEGLILIERMPINPEDKTYNNKYPNTIPLGSIYWNSNNNQYYYVKDGTRLAKTNGLTYKLDPKKEQEPSYQDSTQDTQLLYAGYISTNQRLYIDKDTKEQFVKTLEPIMDESYQRFVYHVFSFDDRYNISYIAENIFYIRNSTNGQLEEIK